MRTNAVNLTDMMDCRLAVEPTLARLAARRRTADELEQIEEIHTRFATSVDNLPLYRQVNFEWHLAVARASRNEPLIALMEAIAQPVLDATGYENFTTAETRRDAVDAHFAMVQAIAVQDEDGAAQAMLDHLLSYNNTLSRTPPKLSKT
jgi:GntR family transcriptional regulator, transcriptional repressor for pyruvate dehydrogenase complex